MGRRAVLLLVGAMAAASCTSDSKGSDTTAAPSSSTAAEWSATGHLHGGPDGAAGCLGRHDDTAETTTTVEEHDYIADITRTSYGVAHIVADDWGSLGFGQGYAFAQDRACTLIDQVIKVRGERAMWFGAGDDDSQPQQRLRLPPSRAAGRRREKFADQPEDIADMVAGYVAGFNAELDDGGPHGWCEGEPWVQPITTTDLYAYLNDVTGDRLGGRADHARSPPPSRRSPTSQRHERHPDRPDDTGDIPVVTDDPATSGHPDRHDARQQRLGDRRRR